MCGAIDLEREADTRNGSCLALLRFLGPYPLTGEEVVVREDNTVCYLRRQLLRGKNTTAQGPAEEDVTGPGESDDPRESECPVLHALFILFLRSCNFFRPPD